jgi:hypothetical protein
MVYFDLISTDFQRSQDFINDLQNLSILEHWTSLSSNVKIALVELTESALVHLWLIATIYLGDMESFDPCNSIHCHKACKRDG